MTAGASVDATRSPSFSAGTATWLDITIGTPASIAARNGSRSTASSRSRDARTTASPWCVSASVSPRPGKCLTAAATPARCSPRRNATPSAATRAGSSPNERIPIAAFAGALATSRTGA